MPTSSTRTMRSAPHFREPSGARHLLDSFGPSQRFEQEGGTTSNSLLLMRAKKVQLRPPLNPRQVRSKKLPVVFVFLSIPKRMGNSNNRFCCCSLALLAFPFETLGLFLPCDLNGPFPDRCRQTPGGRSWYRPAGVCRHVRHRVCLSAGLWGPLCQQANIVRRLPKKAEKRGIIMIKIKRGPRK
jgi:hypothetical protein